MCSILVAPCSKVSVVQFNGAVKFSDVRARAKDAARKGAAESNDDGNEGAGAEQGEERPHA